jgi:regulator of sigma E protease
VELKEKNPVELEMTYEDSYGHEREVISLPNTPEPLTGLGLAYWVQPVVDSVEPNSPAAQAGLKAGDLVTSARLIAKDYDGSDKPGEWEEIKANQWAAVDAAFQTRPPHQIELKVKPVGGGDEAVFNLTGRPDTNWPLEDRGFIFQQDFRTQKAADIGDALNLGARRTVRFIQEVYMNLYAMIFGRVSAKTMSGPHTIANVSYRFAGEDFWQFLLFIGMISVNLAVVNFLPIPVLDGGHMVFLILEKILGRPVPERVFAFAMYLGLAMILSLMIFVITMDIRRLFFGWF